MKRALLLLSLLPLAAFAQVPAPATPAPAPARPAPSAPAAAPPATAARPPAPALSPAQQAQVQKQDAEMGAAALRAAQMVDANRAGELLSLIHI